ncbi:two-component system sensor histidine kinase UhpB [Kribbella aluminosa]|uniref:histidine kinase n=1 Tax=Kribbella aluminosa TaxID=416017 RepID=A0ABS4UH68_9ACTN|nr:two-component system sensor histidine kinase UhpB [Kribbella aluminosa]
MPAVALFWRIFALNAVVLGAATALLLWAPVTVSVPVLFTEASVLIGGLAVMLVANAVLLRVGLAPLARLNRRMSTVDVLRPGQRLPVQGHGGVPDVLRAFNAMLDRLEEERATSAARALSAQESERRRIARELHDEVGQTLTAVLMDLKRAADRSPDPGLRNELVQAQETTRASLDEVRRLAHRLRPGVLEDLGLTSALTALATEVSDHTGLDIHRRFDSGLELDEQTELVLYRVAQESLTNVARHAGASRIELSLLREDSAVVLRIEDDGRGTGPAHEGAGIRGMRERALLIGATLEVGDGPDGGTQVSLTVGSRA